MTRLNLVLLVALIATGVALVRVFYDARRLCAQRFEEIEPGFFGHLNIQKGQTGFLLSNKGDCVKGIIELSGDFNFCVFAQQIFNLITNWRFVIDDHSLDH